MRKKTPFAISKNGYLFVELSAVMTPLVALIDGLPLSFFGKSKKAYLAIDEAISWCKKESQFSNREKYGKMIAVMNRAKDQFREECESLQKSWKGGDA